VHKRIIRRKNSKNKRAATRIHHPTPEDSPVPGKNSSELSHKKEKE
jgi:hypothetical protein